MRTSPNQLVLLAGMSSEMCEENGKILCRRRNGTSEVPLGRVCDESTTDLVSRTLPMASTCLSATVLLHQRRFEPPCFSPTNHHPSPHPNDPIRRPPPPPPPLPAYAPPPTRSLHGPRPRTPPQTPAIHTISKLMSPSIERSIPVPRLSPAWTTKTIWTKTSMEAKTQSSGSSGTCSSRRSRRRTASKSPGRRTRA